MQLRQTLLTHLKTQQSVVRLELLAQFAADAKQINWDENYIALANSKRSSNELCRCSI